MTRTPDDVKKGLECCVDGFSCRTTCPYTMPFFNIEKCTQMMAADALALIQQLEAERDAVMRDMTKNCASCKCAGFNNPGSDGCPYVEQCQNYRKWQWRGLQQGECDV